RPASVYPILHLLARQSEARIVVGRQILEFRIQHLAEPLDIGRRNPGVLDSSVKSYPAGNYLPNGVTKMKSVTQAHR
ncbi:hypothetical protein KC221_30345, partial [Mycobacterium tuberculosis]|nr:hypothetical protein [Mycobacterium tuberculosis]